MALQVGNIITRQLGRHHLCCIPSIADKLLYPHIGAAINTRGYSKKSGTLTPADDTAKPQTALERAKEVADKVKEAKRKFDLYNPMNDSVQPTLAEAQIPPRQADVVIVGGGIMGSSIAYHLTKDNLVGASVLVIEKDPCYTRASTVLSVGGIRQQFSIPENVQMSMHSAKFLRESKYLLTVDGDDLTDVQFNHQGYLFCASEDGVEIMEKNHKVQVDCGASVDLLTPKQLKAQFPWINTDGIALASYGLENEGWFDPWSLLKGFRKKAVANGARYINGEVLEFNVLQPGQKSNLLDQSFAGDGRKIKGVRVKVDGREDLMDVRCAILIIASGCDSGRIGRLLGIGEGDPGELMDVPIPVEPRKRYVYVVHCPDGPGIDCPMLVDNSGAYFRREGFGGNYVCGISPECEEDEPPIQDLDVDYEWFDERIWPKLAHRVPAFDCLKVKSAWAGYYDYNTVDQNAIIGEHPGFPNLYMATGFTGHGIQQAPAVGQYIRNLIIDGKSPDLDLSRFGFERLLYRTPLREINVV